MEEGLTGHDKPQDQLVKELEERLCDTALPPPPEPVADVKPAWMAVFIEALMLGHSVQSAVGLCGQTINHVYARRKTDGEFDLMWKEAVNIGTEALEAEAARRAYHGTLEPVFHKGEVAGHVRKYSDVLMIFLLKARKPEVYRDGAEDGSRGAITLNVQVVNTGEVTPGQVAARVEPAVVPVDVKVVGVGSGEDGQQGDPGVPEATPVPGE